MKLDIIAGSGNDEFYTPKYAIDPILKYINPNLKVWLPFDSNESLILKYIKENGNKCVSTHLSDGYDFFDHYEECDLIVSNPPYSLKNDVFERLFDLGKPFAMLVGVVGLFESQKRFNLFKENQFEVMYLDKRISYLRNYDDEKEAMNPPFSSVWLTSKLLPEKIMFERVIKKGNVK